MLPSLLFITAFVAYFYGLHKVIRTDNKNTLLHHLLMNHIRMDSLYDKLEQLIFLRKYSHYNTKASTMSYDLYLAGVKKQNAIFEKEMEELRTSKFTVEIENYYSQILQKHEQELVILQSEIDRVENTHLIYTPAQSQQSA